MDLNRFRQVEELFCAVVAQAPAERESFLKESCGDDEALRHEIESLLSFDSTYASLIDTPPESLAAEMLAGPQHSQIIGKAVGSVSNPLATR